MSLLLGHVQEQLHESVLQGGFSREAFPAISPQCECTLTQSLNNGLFAKTSACSSLKGDSSILKTPVSKPARSRKHPCLSY